MQATQKSIITIAILFSLASCTKQTLQPSNTANTTQTGLSTTFTIGMSYGGGVIFYIDSTGQHGLIAATDDQGTGVQWWNGFYSTTNAFGKTVGTGSRNTKRIISSQGSGSYAAELCRQYRGGGFKDWYLPSLKELDQLYKKQNKVGNFSATNYWSSTEVKGDNTLAMDEEFGGGFQFNDDKGTSFNVRAIRAF